MAASLAKAVISLPEKPDTFVSELLVYNTSQTTHRQSALPRLVCLFCSNCVFDGPVMSSTVPLARVAQGGVCTVS